MLSLYVPLLLAQMTTSFSGDVLSPRRTAESYAVAVCLAEQKSEYLSDQGDGWASNIVQREAFDLERFVELGRIVKAQVARGDMAAIMVEDPPMTLKELPVQYCVELVELPAIRAAINRSVKRGRIRSQK